VQQVNPQILQDNKSLLKHKKKKKQEEAEHRENCCTDMRVKTDLLRQKKMHPPDRIFKKLQKEHYTESQDLQFLLDSTEWRY
jgi:hypothetical protein